MDDCLGSCSPNVLAEMHTSRPQSYDAQESTALPHLEDTPCPAHTQIRASPWVFLGFSCGRPGLGHCNFHPTNWTDVIVLIRFIKTRDIFFIEFAFGRPSDRGLLCGGPRKCSPGHRGHTVKSRFKNGFVSVSLCHTFIVCPSANFYLSNNFQKSRNKRSILYIFYILKYFFSWSIFFEYASFD